MLRDQVSMRVVPREMSEFNPRPGMQLLCSGAFFYLWTRQPAHVHEKTTGTEIQLDIKSTDVKCS